MRAFGGKAGRGTDRAQRQTSKCLQRKATVHGFSCLEYGYWLAQTIRAIHTTSDIGSVRSRCSALSDLSSTLLLVLRLSSLTMTSSFLVLTTTRSPLRDRKSVV